MAFLVLKEKNKNIFLIFFSILFFVLSFWASGFFSADAANEIYCSNSWAPGNPCVSNAEDCFFCSGFVSTCTVNAPNYNQESPFLPFNISASCSSGNNYCQTASCPADNAGFSEGDLCIVRILNGSSVVASSYSHWDKSEDKCIQCLGNRQYSVCGSTSGLYLSALGPCVGMSSYDGKFDSACDAGVVPSCDEKAEGDACPGGTCNSSGLCVASGAINVTADPPAITKDALATIEFTATVAAVPTSGILVTITGPGINANCTTVATGKCSVNVTANAVGSASVIAALSPLTPGATTVVINAAAACPGGFMVDFYSGSYNIGDQFKVDFSVGNPIGTYGAHSGCVGLYNPSNNLVWELPSGYVRGNGLYGNTTTGISASAGTWKVTISDGTTCDVNSSCFETRTVVGSGPTCAAGDGCKAAGCFPLDPDCVGGACTSLMCGVANSTPCNCGGTALTGLDVWCGFTPDCNPGQGFATQAACVTACLGGVVCNPATCAGCANDTPCSGGGTCQSGVCVPAAATCVPACTGSAVCIDGECENPCGGPGMFISPLGPGYCTIGEILTKATNWILSLVSSIIVLIIIIGGLMYISSAGDEERLRTSKNIIYYAVIGLGIILISYALITEVTDILKGP